VIAIATVIITSVVVVVVPVAQIGNCHEWLDDIIPSRLFIATTFTAK
jgi:hypothetical protein